jgi:serine/threonine protein kinase
VKKRIFSEKEAALCIYDILKGLEYLKSIKVIHRDIKLKNILCD